jgi:NAD(P)-dependent dehydrogenase (short-subunit alcohol dehydrogenase family)
MWQSSDRSITMSEPTGSGAIREMMSFLEYHTGLGPLLTLADILRTSEALAPFNRRTPCMYGVRLRVMVVDLTDTARMRGEVDAAFAALGRIDVVVSNAAYGLFGAVEEVSDKQIERQIATNLIAPMQLVRACRTSGVNVVAELSRFLQRAAK